MAGQERREKEFKEFVYKSLGKRIRQERGKLNLTQEQLAELVGLSTAYVGQIERGERSLTLDKLIAVARELGVTVDFLLAESIPLEFQNWADVWVQLTKDRTESEIALAINMVKLLFSHFDGTGV